MHNGTEKLCKSRDDQLLQLIGQYLCDKGFHGAYNELSKASGIKLENESATSLRRAILDGNWEQGEQALESLKRTLIDRKMIPEINFCILEQRFLELLEANEVMSAVALLRNRLTPLQINRDRVHLLASCILCRTPAEIRAQAGGWTGTGLESRQLLVERIQHFMPAQTMLPPKRLELLVDDAVRTHIKSCVFHNESMQETLQSASLLENHHCSLDKFPAVPIQRLKPTQSELWFCQFSPNGYFLATCGKECNIELWTVNPATRTLSPHKSISTNSHQNFLCWAPDSSKLAVCFSEEQSVVMVFDPVTGNTICQQKVNEDDSFSAATFFADSRTLAFGGMKGTFYIIDTMDEGRILTVVEGYRVQAMTAVYRLRPTDCCFTDNAAPGNHPVRSAGSVESSASRRQLLNRSRFSNCDETRRIPLNPRQRGFRRVPPLPPSLVKSSANSDCLFYADGFTEPMSSVRGPSSASPQLSASRQFFEAESLSQYDELLVADTMNRVSLFRFGYTTKPEPASPVVPLEVSTRGPVAVTVRNDVPWYRVPGYSNLVTGEASASVNPERAYRVLQSIFAQARAPQERAFILIPSLRETGNGTTTENGTTTAQEGSTLPRLFTVNLEGSNYELREQISLFKESNPINSLVLNRCGRQVLLGSQKLGLQLWDIGAGAVVERFVGAKQENNKQQPSMGGVNEDFVICGSEDGKMHFWRCGMGSEPIHSVDAAGPTTVVNCVHWNPVITNMIAAVNDEGELLVFAPLQFATDALEPKSPLLPPPPQQSQQPQQHNGDVAESVELMDWIQHH
ncbi:WD repeat-containing protein 26 [Cichlidogyrus casuarinus]|uniref:WD repeat-containing protein 26 n=1 Tax=Cichlidogyrus casuarinus TaxID=1844966 RepID=A0ABD2PZL4_9PLAT